MFRMLGLSPSTPDLPPSWAARASRVAGEDLSIFRAAVTALRPASGKPDRSSILDRIRIPAMRSGLIFRALSRWTLARCVLEKVSR
ncbi:MAG TPA: hypothetical protein DD471_16005 [Planctomycetes bacterium]|nr:hypothetical protein [Planctomycetota bacterium]